LLRLTLWLRAACDAALCLDHGIPPERVRYHTCYGINMGPRVHDLELKHIVDTAPPSSLPSALPGMTS
jgi:hypothetical protein